MVSVQLMDETFEAIDKENQPTLSTSSLLDRIKGHQKLFADDATVALGGAPPAAGLVAEPAAAADTSDGAASGAGPSLSPSQPRPQLIESYRQKTLELGSDRGVEALSIWLRYAQLQTCALHPLAMMLLATHLALAPAPAAPPAPRATRTKRGARSPPSPALPFAGRRG